MSFSLGFSSPQPVSANRGIIQRTISADRRLLRKIELAVIYQSDNEVKMDVYRESTTEVGKYSLETHLLKNGEWIYIKKDPKKHLKPRRPNDSHEDKLEGIPIWSLKKLNKQDLERLKTILTIASC